MMQFARLRCTRLCPVFLAGLIVAIPSGEGTKADGEDEHDTGQPRISLVAHTSGDQTEFAQLTPIEVKIEGVNKDDRICNMSALLGPYERFSIEVLQDGKIVPKTRYAKARRDDPFTRLTTKVSIPLAPGQTLKGNVIPNLVFDMTKPGDYSIVIGVYYVHGSGKPTVWKILRAKPIKVKVMELPEK